MLDKQKFPLQTSVFCECARIFFSSFFCTKVVGIFFAFPTSISTETHQHSRQSGSKVGREAAKVLKVEILAKCGTGIPWAKYSRRKKLNWGWFRWYLCMSLIKSLVCFDVYVSVQQALVAPFLFDINVFTGLNCSVSFITPMCSIQITVC